MALKIFQYGESSITFSDGDNLLVNATDMARQFGKLPADYTRLDSTQELIAEYMAQNPSMGYPIIKKTGKQGGTWMPEAIALQFAQWLSPKFALWCSGVIKQLLTTGKVELPAKASDAVNPRTMLALCQQLIDAEAKIEDAEERVALLETTVQEQAPAVQYVNTVLQSRSLINISVIAADLGLSGVVLNDLLVMLRIQYKQNGVYILYAAYKAMGIADYKVSTRTDREGNTVTDTRMCWTEKGRAFLIERISPLLQRPGISRTNATSIYRAAA